MGPTFPISWLRGTLTIHIAGDIPFGIQDVNEMRIVATTGGPRAALDARVTDLRIRANTVSQHARQSSEAVAQPLGAPPAGVG